MQFNNPLGQENIGNFSIQRQQVDTTASDTLDAIGGLLKAFTPKPVSRESLNDDDKARGRDLAVQQLKRFEEVAKIEGRDKAWETLQASYGSDVKGRSIHFSQAYEEVLKERLGTPISNWEEEQARAQDTAQRQRFTTLANIGADYLAGQQQDPSMFSQEELFVLGQRISGRQDDVTRQTAEYALGTAQYNASVRERMISSQATFNNFAAQQESALRSFSLGVFRSMANNPNSKLQIQTDSVNNLRLQKTRIISELNKQLAASGGDLSDVRDRVIEVENQYQFMEDLITDKFGLNLKKEELERLGLDATLEYVGKAGQTGNEAAVKAALIQNNMRFPIQDLGKVVKGEPVTTISNEVTAYSIKGGAWVANSYSLSPRQIGSVYKNLGATYGVLARTDDEENQASAAGMLVSQLSEAVFGKPSTVRTATSAEALPSLFGQLATTKPNPKAAQAIIAAAAEEGSTPEELWVESAASITRTQIAPELNRLSGQFRDNMDIQWTGSKFRVLTKRDTRLGASGFGIAASGAGLDVAGKKLEKLYNDMVLSYANVTGASPEDVGPAMLARIQLELGLLNQSNE